MDPVIPDGVTCPELKTWVRIDDDLDGIYTAKSQSVLQPYVRTSSSGLTVTTD